MLPFLNRFDLWNMEVEKNPLPYDIKFSFCLSCMMNRQAT